MSAARILVVDDEPHTRDFVCDGLQALGITEDAVGVSSAEEALREMTRGVPDLVITDIRMPGLNGLDLARYLHQTYPSTKIIVVTGYSTRDIEKTASALAVTALLKKPFGLDTLGQIVRQALSDNAEPQSPRPAPPPALESLERHLGVLQRNTGALWVGLYEGPQNRLLYHTGLDSQFDRPIEQIVQPVWPEQVANLGDKGGNCFLLVEYPPYDLYFCSVGKTHCLTLVYDRRWQTHRIGAIWLTTRQSIHDLAGLLV